MKPRRPVTVDEAQPSLKKRKIVSTPAEALAEGGFSDRLHCLKKAAGFEVEARAAPAGGKRLTSRPKQSEPEKI